jgi:hypothetical protein
VAAQASPARVPPETGAFSASESAADLFEPLAFALAKYVRFPVLGNPVLDQFVGSLKASAQGTADDAVRRAANLIRHGDQTQLLAMIGGAAVLGWLLPEPGNIAGHYAFRLRQGPFRFAAAQCPVPSQK